VVIMCKRIYAAQKQEAYKTAKKMTEMRSPSPK